MNDDLISRKDAINEIKNVFDNVLCGNVSVLKSLPEAVRRIEIMPSAEPTLRERALMLLLNWAVECGFGYDNFPEEYERYKNEIEDMSYFDGMIYIAEKEVEWNG